jgi:hypothetical protein
MIELISTMAEAAELCSPSNAAANPHDTTQPNKSIDFASLFYLFWQFFAISHSLTTERSAVCG